ncbi:HD domain-containing protein [Burkholderiaceae bacterium DAT-1]|nr:HD domain-containing protein [Burkholderiaceae bacterium DAT-1]
MVSLDQQLNFLLEIDRLKLVARRTRTVGGARAENSAEHSWHVAMMAMTLAPHASEPIDIDRVIKLLLVHDIVEIDAGDTFLYDAAASQDKAEREAAAADRIFGLLPADQAARLRALWDEHEDKATAESRFAHACDRAIPMLINLTNEGISWQENSVRFEQVIARNQPDIESIAPALWQWLLPRLESARDRGWLR